MWAALMEIFLNEADLTGEHKLQPTIHELCELGNLLWKSSLRQLRLHLTDYPNS